MRVLVTGGAGFIGSHVTLSLIAAGHEPVIADNYSNSKRSVLQRLRNLSGTTFPDFTVDFTSLRRTDELFEHNRFDAVIHCAGFKSVGESVDIPIDYYHNNISSTLSILTAMKKHKVRRLVFSSSATVYGGGPSAPFREDHLSYESSNPYGQTKVMIERILSDVAATSGEWKVALLRYFNPVGAHESGAIGEDPRDIPTNLMPYIAQVAVGRRPVLTVHGDDYDTQDGTGERDYIHVADLAAGHVAALNHLDSMPFSARAFNLGTGRPTSVLQLVRAFEEVSGRPVPFVTGPRRNGDLAVAYADVSRAERELNWTAQRSVNQMCEDTWRWQSLNPVGLPE